LDIQALHREEVLVILLMVINRAVTLVQHHQHPINPAEPAIHRTIRQHNHRVNSLTLRTNLNHIIHNNLPTALLKILRKRMAHHIIPSNLTVHLRALSNRMGPRRTLSNHLTVYLRMRSKLLMVRSSPMGHLQTRSKATEHLRLPNSHPTETYNTKTHMEEAIHHNPNSTLRLLVTKEALDMVAHPLGTFHSRNINTFKVCIIQNILVVCTAIVQVLVALLYRLLLIHITARMPPLSLHTVRLLLINMVDSKGGNAEKTLLG